MMLYVVKVQVLPDTRIQDMRVKADIQHFGHKYSVTVTYDYDIIDSANREAAVKKLAEKVGYMSDGYRVHYMKSFTDKFYTYGLEVL